MPLETTKNDMKQIFVETFYHDGQFAGVGCSLSSLKKAVAYIAELAEERDGKISDDRLSTTYACCFPSHTTWVTIKMEESELL